MKNTFIAAIFIATLSFSAAAEVEYRDYHYEAGEKVYYDNLESASGPTVVKRERTYQYESAPSQYVPLEDVGGRYDADNDVYRPALR